MSFLKNLGAHITRAFSDDGDVAHHLVTLAAYLSALAAAGSDRLALVNQAGRQRMPIAGPFRQARVLAEQFAFDQSRALARVAEKAYPPSLKGFIDRFAHALAAGTPTADHFAIESKTISDQYNHHYERALESVRHWTGGYSAMQVSAALMTVILMVISLVYPLPPGGLQRAAGIIVAILVIAVHTVARAAPSETRTLPDARLPELRMARILLFLAPFGVLVGRQAEGLYGFGAVLAVTGVALMPAGIMAVVADRRIEAYERALPAFCRALARLAGGRGVSVATAVQQVAPETLGALREPGLRLQRRLRLGVGHDASWRLFVTETGSELVERTAATLVDAVRLGTPPAVAGEIAADYAAQMCDLRAKRRTITAPFAGLNLFMHALMSMVMLMMLETVQFFGGQMAILAEMGKSFPANPLGWVPGAWWPPPAEIDQYRTVVYLLVVFLALANGLVPRWVRGSHWLTVCWYAGLTLAASGLAMLITPYLAAQVFTFSVGS